MKKSLLTGRRRWVIAGAAGALLIGSAAIATTAVANDADDGAAGQAQVDDDDNGDDDDDHRGDDAPATTTAPAISPADAADAAQAEVTDGVVVSVELENGPVWNVELITPDYTEHDVDVNADSGEVGDHRTDAEDDADDWNEDSAIAKAAKLGIAEAGEAALGEVTDGTITSVELDGSAEAPVWDFDLATPDGVQHEVKVNAADGKVVAAATDDDDSDDDDSNDDSDDSDDDSGDDDDSDSDD